MSTLSLQFAEIGRPTFGDCFAALTAQHAEHCADCKANPGTNDRTDAKAYCSP